VLCRMSYVRMGYARLGSNQRPLPPQDSALSTELRACEEPPAGVEPALRPYKGRVLAVDTTEACEHGDGRSRTDIFLGASEVLDLVELHPRVMRTGGVEPPQREATGLQPAELAGAQRPREGGNDEDADWG
jgi:hypothetical protein